MSIQAKCNRNTLFTDRRYKEKQTLATLFDHQVISKNCNLKNKITSLKEHSQMFAWILDRSCRGVLHSWWKLRAYKTERCVSLCSYLCVCFCVCMCVCVWAVKQICSTPATFPCTCETPSHSSAKTRVRPREQNR